MESVESDSTQSAVKKVSLDLKGYLRNLEAYSVANGKGVVAIVNNFMDEKQKKNGYDYRAGWCCLNYNAISLHLGVYYTLWFVLMCLPIFLVGCSRFAARLIHTKIKITVQLI